MKQLKKLKDLTLFYTPNKNTPTKEWSDYFKEYAPNMLTVYKMILMIEEDREFCNDIIKNNPNVKDTDLRLTAKRLLTLIDIFKNHLHNHWDALKLTLKEYQEFKAEQNPNPLNKKS